MKKFKVTRVVKQIFTIQAKDREDAFDKLLTKGTPKGFFETRILSESVVKTRES